MRRLFVLIVVCGLLTVATGCGTPSRSPVGPPSGGSGPSATAGPAGTAAPTGPAGPTAPPGGSGRRSGAPAPASPTLIAFVQVRGGAGDAAGEVTGSEQLDPFLTGPPAADQQVRDAVRRHRGAGVRLFAFLLTGCQNNGASLVIQPARVHAVLTGGLGVRCFVAEHFLAVFAVPAALVPDRVRIG